MIAGVLTDNEKTLLRTRPQQTQLYLAFPDYKTIYTARTDGAPADNDNIISVTFDGGVGILANVLPGMTLLIGSGPGLWDIGIARIRDDSLDLGGGTGIFNIGITSEIEWADDLYLTVIDDYGIWAKHPRITAGVSFMDYDIPYGSQNVYGPAVPIIGSHRILELTGPTVTASFDASGCYNCIGTPTSYDYAWYVDNVLVSNAVSVDIDFTAIGTYDIRFEITSNYVVGSVVVASPMSIAVRYVIVYDKAHPLNTSFTIESKPTGDYQEGGWTYSVTMHANATEATIRDRALCLLVAKDWYGTAQQSIGPLEGCENIVCVGWIDGESIQRSNDLSFVTFDVQGPAWWLGVQRGFPTGIDDTNAAPTDWLHIENLTPRKGLFSFLHWRTTTTVVTDCAITSDTHRLASTYTPAGVLSEQLRAIAQRVNAGVVCDRYGRLYCEIDTQFVPTVSRTFPIVQTMTNRDWRDEITIERRIVPQVGQVDLSGVYYSGNFATSNSIFSLSPGHYPKHHGPDVYKVERIALTDQAEANFIAGAWLAYLNNEYPNVDTPMSSNYRAVDIAPRMFIQQNLDPAETPRGLEWNNKRLIPREVSFDFNPKEGLLLTDITLEAETFAGDAVIGDPPITPPPPPPPPEPPVLCNDPDALNFGESAPCVYRTLADVVLVMTETQLGVSQNFYTSASPAWTNCKTGALAGASVDVFVNAALSLTGEAWVLTGYGDLNANGLWYCSDILAAAPSFMLILSHNGWATLIGSAPGNGITSLGCGDDGVAYITGNGSAGTSDACYGYGTAAIAIAGGLPNISGKVMYSICSGASVRLGLGRGGVPEHRIEELNSGAHASVLTIVPNQGAPDPAVGFMRWNGNLYSYVDGGAAAALVYTGAANVGPVISDGTNCITIRGVDGVMMNGAAALATPLAAFLLPGISFGGYCLGPAGYGEILACAFESLGSNFISLRNTGGTWTIKDGNWVAVMGGNYAGGTYPMILTTSV